MSEDKETITPDQSIGWACHTKREIAEVTTRLKKAGKKKEAELFQPLIDAIDSLPQAMADCTGDPRVRVHYRVGRPVLDENDVPDKDHVKATCALTGEDIWVETPEALHKIEDHLPKTMELKAVSLFALLKEEPEEIGLKDVGGESFLQMVYDFDHYEDYRDWLKQEYPDTWENRMRVARAMTQRFIDEGYLEDSEDLSQYSAKVQSNILGMLHSALGGNEIQSLDDLLGGAAVMPQGDPEADAEELGIVVDESIPSQ